MFGSKKYKCINKARRGKLDDRTQQGVIVRYDNSSKGYHVYTKVKESIIARTVIFIENSTKNPNNMAAVNPQLKD